MAEAIDKAATGIEGFDNITYGGLPRGRTTLIIGGPGAGKTIFALQALVNGARESHEPGIFVAFEESAHQIVANAATFGWDLDELQQERLFFLDARVSPATVQTGEFDLQGMLAGLADKVQEMGAKRIVFDGLDVLLTMLSDEAAERREAYRLHEWLKQLGLTGIITAKSDSRDRINIERYSFMQFMVDCVVALQHTLVDRISLRSIRVLKFRGSKFDEGQFPLVIADDGIEIATFATGQITFDVSTERVSTGVERLDRMLDGGYYRGSSILITGVPGTAKTTLSAAFAKSACTRGEKVVFVSFDEAGEQIVRNLRSIGVDLQTCIDAGSLLIHAVRTEARSAEEHLVELKRLIVDFEPKHLVLDPVSALVKTGGHVSAIHAALRLLDYAKCRGITVLCTSLLAATEPVTEATNLEISTIADTWIHLAYKILGGERNRTITVVKARGIRHSNQVRELLLSDRGIDLADVYTAGGDVLVGTARFEKENEIRRVRHRQMIELRLKREQLQAVESDIAARMESLQRELKAARAEIELFETESVADTAAIEQYDTSVRRLRSADESAAND